MYGQESLQCISLPAHASMASSQYLFVNVNSDGEAYVQTSDGGEVVGVNQDKQSNVGSPVAVAFAGVTQVVAGGVIVAGASVSVNTAGKAITAASTDLRHGKALTAAAASGDIIRVLLFPNGAAV